MRKVRSDWRYLVWKTSNLWRHTRSKCQFDATIFVGCPLWRFSILRQSSKSKRTYRMFALWWWHVVSILWLALDGIKLEGKSKQGVEADWRNIAVGKSWSRPAVEDSCLVEVNFRLFLADWLTPSPGTLVAMVPRHVNLTCGCLTSRVNGRYRGCTSNFSESILSIQILDWFCRGNIFGSWLESLGLASKLLKNRPKIAPQ